MHGMAVDTSKGLPGRVHYTCLFSLEEKLESFRHAVEALYWYMCSLTRPGSDSQMGWIWVSIGSSNLQLLWWAYGHMLVVRCQDWFKKRQEWQNWVTLLWACSQSGSPWDGMLFTGVRQNPRNANSVFWGNGCCLQREASHLALSSEGGTRWGKYEEESDSDAGSNIDIYFSPSHSTGLWT